MTLDEQDALVARIGAHFIAMTEQSKVRTVSLIQVDASEVMTIESLPSSFLSADL